MLIFTNVLSKKSNKNSFYPRKSPNNHIKSQLIDENSKKCGNIMEQRKIFDSQALKMPLTNYHTTL